MLKAMYGCIQASALWYALIKKFLEDQGYQVSETDRCVFRKRKGDRIFILLLYVDDILANVDGEEAEKLRKSLIKRFGTVQFEIGGRLSYLGMQLEMKETGTVIDMTFYVKQLLEDVDVPVRASPGTKLTFMIAENAKALTEVDRKVFHTQVAKLLFLSKRARPDILTVVSFLCTRVQTATTEDQAKLNRVLGYLKGTQDRVLLLRSQEKSEVRAYVDAAYALHNDSKSHSGVALYVGKTLVYVSSKKQKCMSKSPTEAELIALTDNLGFVELFQEFVEFLTMSKQKPATIYQDCSAVVTLVTKGGGITRTKHLRARMNLGKEAVEEKRAFIVHVSAEEMKADGFSKPYDPAEHKPFAEMIQGETG
jgi:predicted SpoU family rRNA methylase